MIVGIDANRRLIERAVSTQLGRPWRVSQVRDMADYASHPSAILSDGVYAVFAKFGSGVHGREQFTTEVDGLRLLAEQSGVLTPTPLGILAAPDGWILLLEAVAAVARGPQQWRDIGRALARIHRVHADVCGLPSNGFFGPLPQDNTPTRDWPTFYAERRLRPGLKLAVDAGHLPRDAARQVERLIERLPGLCGPTVSPRLLHGDAQQNNFISSNHGAVAIDPAVHFGHPEFDLALVDYFEPVPVDVLDSYREELPIDPGFAGRRDLWRVWGYLACVANDGAAYLGKLMEAVQKYA